MTAHRPIRLVVPRPDHAPWPRRVAGVPYCPECGMTVGHWPGAPCNEPEGD